MNHNQITITDILIIIAIAAALYLMGVGAKKMQTKYYWTNAIIAALVCLTMLFCAIFFYISGQHTSIVFILFFIWGVVRLFREIKVTKLHQKNIKYDGD